MKRADGVGAGVAVGVEAAVAVSGRFRLRLTPDSSCVHAQGQWMPFQTLTDRLSIDVPPGDHQPCQQPRTLSPRQALQLQEADGAAKLACQVGEREATGQDDQAAVLQLTGTLSSGAMPG